MERRTFFSSVGKCGLSAGLLGIMPSMLLTGKNISASPVMEDDPDSIHHSCSEKMEFTEEWLKKFMGVLDENLDVPLRNKIMESNGKVCMTSYLKQSGQKIQPISFEEFAKRVSESENDGSISIEGRTIYYAYMQNYQGKPAPEEFCLCPLVESKPAGLSPTYCQCSVGYVREYFTQILGQKVEVTLQESVLRGGKRCRFKIAV
jgi:hypothetical protein